jgi:hypothetical protein
MFNRLSPTSSKVYLKVQSYLTGNTLGLLYKSKPVNVFNEMIALYRSFYS